MVSLFSSLVIGSFKGGCKTDCMSLSSFLKGSSVAGGRVRNVLSSSSSPARGFVDSGDRIGSMPPFSSSFPVVDSRVGVAASSLPPSSSSSSARGSVDGGDRTGSMFISSSSSPARGSVDSRGSAGSMVSSPSLFSFPAADNPVGVAAGSTPS